MIVLNDEQAVKLKEILRYQAAQPKKYLISINAGKLLKELFTAEPAINPEYATATHDIEFGNRVKVKSGPPPSVPGHSGGPA